VNSGGVRSVGGVSGEPDRTDTVTPTAGSVAAVHILLATDADWIVDEVTAALGGPETSFTVCREGRQVSRLVDERSPDLVIVDMQIGSMGGMAVVKALRLDESAGVLPHARVIMLLDRVADLYLAQRSDAEGWLVKPLDALRLRRATNAVAAGGTFTEGVPSDDPAVDETTDVVDDAERVDESETATAPEGDSVPTG
jgi:DNA-binding response OmpR family regulator